VHDKETALDSLPSNGLGRGQRITFCNNNNKQEEMMNAMERDVVPVLGELTAMSDLDRNIQHHRPTLFEESQKKES
jgi:hypothetical protein